MVWIVKTSKSVIFSLICACIIIVGIFPYFLRFKLDRRYTCLEKEINLRVGVIGYLMDWDPEE